MFLVSSCSCFCRNCWSEWSTNISPTTIRGLTVFGCCKILAYVQKAILSGLPRHPVIMITTSQERLSSWWLSGMTTVVCEILSPWVCHHHESLGLFRPHQDYHSAKATTIIEAETKWPTFSWWHFSSAFSWLKIVVFWLKFHSNLFPRVQLAIFHHCFR